MSIAERLKSAAHELGGKVKEVAGKTVGNPKLEQQGRAEQAAAQVQEQVDKVGEQAKGLAQEAAGKVESAVGAATGDTAREIEGKAEEIEGKLGQKTSS